LIGCHCKGLLFHHQITFHRRSALTLISVALDDLSRPRCFTRKSCPALGEPCCLAFLTRLSIRCEMIWFKSLPLSTMLATPSVGRAGERVNRSLVSDGRVAPQLRRSTAKS
jgi:hypothetical protein